MGRRVLRNNTTRDDAVYIVECTVDSHGIYDVIGRWGRWETFCRTGNLQSKNYYHGKYESNALGHVRDIISKKSAGHYVVVQEMNTPFTWDLPVPPVVTVTVTPPAITTDDSEEREVYSTVLYRGETAYTDQVRRLLQEERDAHKNGERITVSCVNCGSTFRAFYKSEVMCSYCGQMSKFILAHLHYDDKQHPTQDDPPAEPHKFTRANLLEF